MERTQQSRGCTEGLPARHPVLKNAPSHAGRSIPTPVPRSLGLREVRAGWCAGEGLRGEHSRLKEPFFHPVSVGWISPGSVPAAVQKHKSLLPGTLQDSAPRCRILPCHGCILQPPTSFRETHGMGIALRMLRCPPTVPTTPGDTHLHASSATGAGAGSGWRFW